MLKMHIILLLKNLDHQFRHKKIQRNSIFVKYQIDSLLELLDEIILFYLSII